MVYDSIVVGAGLAGLCCANHLHRAGLRVLLVEAADGVGGRVRTDQVDGFLLDRGFQVFLTAYPEAKQVLDYEALRLRPFQPGALVRHGGSFHRITDPWRQPLGALGTLGSPIGSLFDKLRVARLRSRVLRGTLEELFAEPETTTLEALRQAGFSPLMIDRFFRPFLGGIFLDPDLRTSSRMFTFVFRMFSTGDACLPEGGMEAIPRQLVSRLPRDSVRLGSPVTAIDEGLVRLENGDTLAGRTVVVAVDEPQAAGLLGDRTAPEGQGVTCLYFAADSPPVQEPVLVLDGEGRGPVNNLCVPSLVAPSYAPRHRSLVSVTVLGLPSRPETALQHDVRDQLAGWFGDQVSRWQHLRTYRIPYALPCQAPPRLATPERPVRHRPGVYVCGDYLDTASIQGAMVSGRRAAQAVLDDQTEPNARNR